jgi:hypothetical protein
MLIATPEYQSELVTLTKAREMYGKIEFRQLDITASSDCTPTASSTESISSVSSIVDGVEGITSKYATFEKDRWLLDGTFRLMPDSSYDNAGWWSSSLSDETTGMFSPNLTITLQFTVNHSSVGITIFWDRVTDECAKDFVVTYYDSSSTVIQTTTVTGNTLSEYVDEISVSNYRKIIITVSKWSLPSRRARIEEILFGVIKVFSNETGKLVSFTVQEEIDTIASKDVSNKLNISIDNSDNAYDILNPTGIYQYMQANQRVNAYIGVKVGMAIEYVSLGKFYLSTWATNQNSLEAKFTATDLLDLLHQKTYYKGLKQSITLYNLAVAVMTDFGLTSDNYILDGVLSSITVTNFLPICTYKEAIQHIAIAGQCVFYVDRLGVINIKRVDSASTGVHITRDSMREPTPKITLSSLLKQVDVEVITLVEAGATSTIAKPVISVTGSATVWITYDNPATTVSATVSSGSITASNYYTNGCSLTISATGNITVTVIGKVLTLSKSTTSVSTSNTDGITQNVKNQLIDSATLATSVANWIVSDMAYRKILEVQSRTNPLLEITDIIDIDTQFDVYTDARVVKQSYEYNGGLKGILGVKG